MPTRTGKIPNIDKDVVLHLTGVARSLQCGESAELVLHCTRLEACMSVLGAFHPITRRVFLLLYAIRNDLGQKAQQRDAVLGILAELEQRSRGISVLSVRNV